jgi:hypothetical protein
VRDRLGEHGLRCLSNALCLSFALRSQYPLRFWIDSAFMAKGMQSLKKFRVCGKKGFALARSSAHVA